LPKNPRRTAGNYGVLDSIQALRWVGENIGAFNGDTQRIMLTGHSFGGRIICAVLAAPEAAGLFQSVAIQSGTCSDRSVLSSQINYYTRNPPVLEEHPLLLAEVGCAGTPDVLQCLRNLDAAELIDAGERLEEMLPGARFPFRPVIDGVVVQSDPYTAVRNKVVGDIGIIVGTTEKDVEYLFAKDEIPTDYEYRYRLAQIFPPPLDEQIYAIYPSADFAEPKEAYVTLWSDYIEHCVAEELARSAHSAGMPAYLYQISRGFDNGTRAGQGAVHAIGVVYLFGNYAAWDYTPDEQALAISEAMQAGWSNLAADPLISPALILNASLVWPAYEPAAKPYVDFSDAVQSVTNHSNGRCEKLRTLLPL
jgi:para-nitrobenzyl esterase